MRPLIPYAPLYRYEWGGNYTRIRAAGYNAPGHVAYRIIATFQDAGADSIPAWSL